MHNDDIGDDALRRAYAALRTRRAAQPLDRRPALERLDDVLDADRSDRLSDDAREQALDDALASGAADELALLYAVRTAASTAAGGATITAASTDAAGAASQTTSTRGLHLTQGRPRFRRGPWAIAAGLVMAVGLPWALSRDRAATATGEGSTPDSANAGATFRAAALPSAGPTLLAPAAVATGTSSPNDALVWRWSSVAGADRYTIEWLDAAGAVVTRVETTDTVFVLAATDRSATGEAVRAASRRAEAWWVSARLSDGTQVRSELRLLKRVATP